MGTALATCGDVCTCTRKHENANAIGQSTGKFGVGNDLEDAVFAATNRVYAEGEGLSNQVELSIGCENLPNYDTFTRTDGKAVLYQQRGHMWHEIGRTETIMDNLNPKFITSFTV